MFRSFGEVTGAHSTLQRATSPNLVRTAESGIQHSPEKGFITDLITENLFLAGGIRYRDRGLYRDRDRG